jgi:hypothetical protein
VQLGPALLVDRAPRQSVLSRVARRWDFALGLLLSLSLLWPLVVAPYFVHDDDVQTIRIYEMHQCVIDGQVPCRWVPDLGGGYGYPEFNYYAPLPYYVGEIFYAVSHDMMVAAKWTFGVGFLLAFFSTYLAAGALWGRLGGSLSAIFFMFAPYHAENLYGRGAMDELWAMAAIPLAFWAFVRLGKRPGGRNSLLLGLALAAVVLCHNLSAMLLAALLSILTLVRLSSSRQFSSVPYLAGAALWGAAISAFYVLPVLLEGTFVHLETLIINESNYAEHFADLHRLLGEAPWWLGNPATSAQYLVGSVHLVAWALSVCAAVVFWRTNRPLRAIVIPFTAIMLVCIYMIHPASRWIWDHGGPLAYLQFPWRLLTLVSFGTSLLAGASLLLVGSRTARVTVWWVMVVLVVVMNVGWFRPRAFLYVDQASLLSGLSWDRLKMSAIWDFLPRSAQVAPRHPTSSVVEELSGDSQLTDIRAGSNWVTFKATSGADALIQIDRYEFPRWDITVDGQSAAHGHDPVTGLINVALSPGVHTVEARLRDTPVRTAGNAISLAALVLCAVVGLRAALAKRRSTSGPQGTEATRKTALAVPG